MQIASPSETLPYQTNVIRFTDVMTTGVRYHAAVLTSAAKATVKRAGRDIGPTPQRYANSMMYAGIETWTGRTKSAARNALTALNRL